MRDATMTRITTIIPTFQRPELLARAIRSVLGQTWQDLQVCVYDNASGDATRDIVLGLAAKDPRVKYFCHPENVGAFANFNFGLQRVDTPFFSFLSDDDYLLPDFYASAMSHFQNHPEVGFVSTGVLNENSHGDVFPDGSMRGRNEAVYPSPDGMLQMIRHGEPTWTGIVFRTEVRDRNGLLRDYGAVADTFYVLHAAKRFSFYFDPRPGAVFIPASATVARSIRGRFTQFWPVWATMTDELLAGPELSCEDRFWVRTRLSERLKKRMFQLAVVSVLKNDLEAAEMSAHFLQDYYPGSEKLPRALIGSAKRAAITYWLLRIVNALRIELLRVKQRRQAQSIRTL
ncbi:MAG: glycosyltransferase family 2 protein [Rhodocyclales bacterium]|nr:glycosyltransferase family 2 protein [Rhodocyclales bacterium]